MVTISQSAYIERIIKCFNLHKTHTMPLDPNVKLTTTNALKNEQEKHAMAKLPYRQAIGSLMWATVATQPAIAFAVSLLSQF